MYESIIKNYLKNLSYNDILYFAKKNNIYLNDLELDIVYNTLINDYQVLLSDNYQDVFNKVKNKLSHDNYNKIYNLFIEFKNKYKNLI